MSSKSRYFLVMMTVVVAYIALVLSTSPSFSGTDAFIFRDAGWNLANSGTFSSLGLPYMADFEPKLYAHYTPIMPLLFAGYCAVFPSNRYSGDIFNILAGAIAASTILRELLRSRSVNRVLSATAVIVATLPITFITHDRPEALGLALFAIATSAAWRQPERALKVGVLSGAVFLVHPFAGILAGAWSVAAFTVYKHDSQPLRKTIGRMFKAVVGASASIGLWALVMYKLDPTSLHRFVAHAFGVGSGVGVVLHPARHSYISSLKHGIGSGGVVSFWGSIGFLLCNLLFVWFVLRHRSGLRYREWIVVAVACISSLGAIALFPAQGNYFRLLTFLIPVGLLVASWTLTRFGVPSMLLIALACFWQVPTIALMTVEHVQLRGSFQAASAQPMDLLALLPSANSIVAVNGSVYDLYKPVIPNLVNADYLSDQRDLRKIDGVANCYAFYHGPAGQRRPLPAGITDNEFQIVEASPDHVWITFLGRVVMRSQQGWGCDLYVRKEHASDNGESRDNHWGRASGVDSRLRVVDSSRE